MASDELVPPVKVGDEVDLDITEIGGRGDGVGRIEGMVVFVPNSKPGESVHVQITKVAARYGVARRLEQ